ncbi:MAG: UDP-3-O-acyl-N-acetylglucosamine deacetylase, partial [Natronospirillum sp.]
YLRANNLALGANFNNAIAMDEYRILNEDGLRYDDEFVKHKILDAVGDLYLLGHSLIGHFIAEKSGHGLNNMLLRELICHPESWEYMTFDSAETAPISYRPVVA